MYWGDACDNLSFWSSFWWLPGFGLVILILGLVIIGLLVRNTRQTKIYDASCPHCSGGIQRVFFRCPHCGETLKSNCPGCSRVVESGWTCCPHCTETLTKQTVAEA
jgi:hypothetical protein